MKGSDKVERYRRERSRIMKWGEKVERESGARMYSEKVERVLEFCVINCLCLV